MRMLLLGANGQVGFELLRALQPLGEVCPATRDGRVIGGLPSMAADLSEPESLRELVRELAPAAVINAAAYTGVDDAEDDADVAQRVNALAPGVLAEEARRAGALLVHYSTDYVFTGDGDSPYLETDPTVPTSIYGQTKLAGEEAIRRADAPHVILRTAWVYGARGNNFLRTMLRLASEREQLRVVDDQIGSPTWTRLIAEASAQIVGRWLGPDGPGPRALPGRCMGTFHLTCGGHTSWHGFASALLAAAHRAGLIARLPAIAPVPSLEFPTRARRPAYSVLGNERIAETYGLALPDWRRALALCIEDMAGAGHAGLLGEGGAAGQC